MGLRSDLHSRFLAIPGVQKVYFQPPESVKLEYPCIIYSRSPDNTKFADNIPYSHVSRYSVTVIDRDPESSIAEAVKHFPMCKIDRIFTSSNLHHYNFNLFY